VLVRAHGEPPETYAIARKNNITLVEATCPVVLKLQEKVGQAWEEMKATGGTVVIAGKKGHPEVIGLSGHTGHNAVVAESPDDVAHIDFHKPVHLFAQTTISRQVFEEIREYVRSRMEEVGSGGDLKSSNSICGQVSGRIPKLKSFCRSHDVIIFVSGKNSSNGRSLFKACRAANPSSYHISSADDLDLSWLRGAKSIGISGATSTPRWQMEEIAKNIEEQHQHVPETD
jgi:4-hydroxy-3-methylbut-2-enyl diphosphate reductase